MAGPASRVSRVVMTGPLAAFAGVYELELRRRRYRPLTVVNQLRRDPVLRGGAVVVSAFCFIEGPVEADLSQAALPATGRRRSSLPRGITKPDANALLAVIVVRRSGDAPTRRSSRCCGWGCGPARWPG
jgi:hypothetical protein